MSSIFSHIQGLTAKPKPKPKQSRKAEPGRVVALFGARGSGLSTIVRVLSDASKKDCRIVHWPYDDLYERSFNSEGEVIFIDCVRNAADVKHLVEERLVDGASQGRIVQVMRPDVEPLEELNAWNQRRIQIEEMIHTYSLPYFTLMNGTGDLEAPIAELARVARLKS